MDEHSEHWMQRIVDRLDRLIAIGERVEGEVRLPSEEEAQTFADAEEPAKEPPKKWRILGVGEVVQEGDWVNAESNLPSDPPNGLGWKPAIAAGLTVLKSDGCIFARPVAEEPAKEAEHPAGPKPDPGEGYRILSKNPPEDLTPGDECEDANGGWTESDNARTHGRQEAMIWYRRKIGFPAKEPGPAWEPKVGDWVRVTRPENWREWKEPLWQEEMHQYDGKILRVALPNCGWHGNQVKLEGVDWFFHCSWLSPPKPAEPEYREPVLPGDVGKVCEFSINGNAWTEAKLRGYAGHLWQSVCSEVVGELHWVHARIKKDA